MTLKEKLTRLKHLDEDKKEADWIIYKNNWVDAIDKLYQTITDKWFADFAAEKLMEFTLISVNLLDPHIDNYATNVLEITLVNKQSIVLSPLSAITSEYFGRLDLYILGSMAKRVSIIRETEYQPYEWTIVDSVEKKDHPVFTKERLEDLIDKWIS